MTSSHSHVRDRSRFRLTLSEALFFAAGVAFIGQAETATPSEGDAWKTPISAPAPMKGPCTGYPV